MAELDLIIKNGKIVTSSDVYSADIGKLLMLKESMFFQVGLMYTYICNCHFQEPFLQTILKMAQKLQHVEV